MTHFVSEQVRLFLAVIYGQKIRSKSFTGSRDMFVKKVFFTLRGGSLDIGLAKACKHMC